MIQRRYRQRSLFEAAVGSVENLIEGLVPAELERLDRILSDEGLVEAVVEQLANRSPQSRTRGRPGTPAEVVLRMLALKRLKGWSFEQTELEVRQSLVYRHLTRVYFERVPDAKTLVRLSGVLGAEAVEALHRRLVAIAREEGVIRGRRSRIDTTVTETNIHYPTDSSLLADGVRVLTREAKRIEKATGVVGRRLRDRTRATTRRVLEIGRAARSRSRDARAKLVRGYRRLLAIVRAVVRDAERVAAEVAEGVRIVKGQGGCALARGKAGLAQFLPLVRRVIAQTEARVFGGDTHYPEKLLSLFEPHTEAIRKGKAARPTEFGKLVALQEAENQIVVGWDVFAQRPDERTLLVPTIERHKRVFGRAPHLLAADRGFWSYRNRQEAKAQGVKRVCVPAVGRLSRAQRAEQHTRWFRRGQRYRTGSEGRISVMKRRDGLGRCRYRGPRGMKRWVGWGVISNNLWVLMRSSAG